MPTIHVINDKTPAEKVKNKIISTVACICH